ncbi:NgoFVII restriction endonuclease [Enterococcus casseliflavus]|nr:NgoFVII restriction endonuclease [Enterococcus casseliflavus]
MEILYSNIPPLIIGQDQKAIANEIKVNIALSDKIVFAVGYVSRNSLIELDRMVEEYSLKNVILIAGMYATDGIPESIYIEITKLHDKWTRNNIGSIYFVNNMSYHGKLYTFWKNGSIFKTIEGSANLSVLAPTGTLLRQYEIATSIDDSQKNIEFAEHLEMLQNRCTSIASDLEGFRIVHEPIELLNGIENVTQLTQSTVETYQKSQTDITIRFPIKAPLFDKRFSNDRNDFAKSNINVCYGKGRKNSKGIYDRRNWYETQLTVAKEVWSLPSYPTDKPFFVITDDGYQFEAHTTSDNHKQFTAYDSDRILGRWIKGRLVANGLLVPVDDVNKDPDHLGVVTSEMLQQANMEVLVLTKTNRQELGRVYSRKDNGRLDKSQWNYEPLDVWTIRFDKEMGEN